MILDPLAMMILKAEFQEGDTIEAGNENSQVVFQKMESVAK